MCRFEQIIIKLTEAQLSAWKALPPVSAEELEAIKKETPAERDAAVDQLLSKILGIRPRNRQPKPVTIQEQDIPRVYALARANTYTKERASSQSASASLSILPEVAAHAANQDATRTFESLGDVGVADRAFLSRIDIAVVSSQVDDLVKDGHACSELISAWRRHLFAEYRRVRVKQSGPCPELAWKEDPPARIRHFVDQIDIEIVPSLGENVRAASFVGPWRTRIVLGQDAIRAGDALEAEFLVYKMFLHTLGGLPGDSFGCWISYKREIDSQAVIGELNALLTDENYREQEARTNEGATCLMYDYYVIAQTMTPLSRSLVRSALGRRAAGIPFLREIFVAGGRSSLRAEVAKRLQAAYASFIGTLLDTLIRPKLRFGQHVAVE